MSVHIELFTYNGDPKVVNKELTGTMGVLSSVDELNEDLDLLNPSIVFNIGELTFTQLSKVNYAYIQEFSRYYFITKIEFLENDLVRINMRVDVLKNFASIFSLYGIAEMERTTNRTYYNPELVDSLLRIDTELDIVVDLYDGTNPFTYNLTDDDFCFAITYI